MSSQESDSPDSYASEAIPDDSSKSNIAQDIDSHSENMDIFDFDEED